LIDISQNSTYIKLNSIDTPKGILTAWHCPELDNPKWDAFLNTSIYGHFYQTSMWARVRIIDGWQPLLTIITLNDQLIGGFQILVRIKSCVGKIGLLLKGPVVDSNDPMTINFVISTLKKTVRLYKIRALIGQPPDKDNNIHVVLKKSDFSPNHLENAIKNNTVSIDLRGSEEEILKKIKRQKRQNINTAKKNSVTVREGQKDDLRTFFNYMLETCKRQQVSPSPSSEEFLLKMWDLFVPSGHMKLFMAQCEGTDVTGLVVLPFSDTAYMWKFGWSGNYGHYRPNEMLYWEIFRWAKKHGYQYADVGAISAAHEESSQHGSTPVEDLSKSYSRFKSEFGGETVALSNGFVYIPNPLIRWAYNLLMPYINSRPSLKKRILFSGD
jgi:lipid II:glycine glycyltransferase (peptidoglycan interpeptide bridge formation enzyme)